MTDIRAIIRMDETGSYVIELSMFDKLDRETEIDNICIGRIYVDEIEMTEDFVKYLYKGIEEKEGK